MMRNFDYDHDYANLDNHRTIREIHARLNEMGSEIYAVTMELKEAKEVSAPPTAPQTFDLEGVRASIVVCALMAAAALTMAAVAL